MVYSSDTASVAKREPVSVSLDKFASTCLAILELWSFLPQLFLPHTLLLVVYQIVQRKHTAEEQLGWRL